VALCTRCLKVLTTRKFARCVTNSSSSSSNSPILLQLILKCLFTDRSTPVGQLINDYLTKNIDLTDNAIHLLFSANRWELE